MALCEWCNMSPHSGTCDREALKMVIGALREDLRIRTAELQAHRKLEGIRGVVMINSIVSGRTMKPRIDIQIGEIHTQVPVDNALDIAYNIIQVCAGSYADGFIVNFLIERLEQPVSTVGQILREFRAYRDQLAREFEKEQEEG